MNRRFFNKTFLSSIPIAALYPTHSLIDNSLNIMTLKPAKPRKAPRLKKGDTIGLIAPGSALSAEKIEQAVKNLETMGWKVKLGKYVKEKNGFLAGTDEQRLADLHEMFADQNVQGIWCARGGYGCTRLLPYIDYSLIKKNPKVLVGYSDITALLQAIFIKTGLIGFHGPVAVSPFNPFVVANLKAVLMQSSKGYTLLNAEENQSHDNLIFHTQVIRPGKVRGCLSGGNLSLIAATTGTPFDWKVKNKILLLEDVGEKPYRIDRMLTQLIQSQKIQRAAAIVLGVFKGCEAKSTDDSLSLIDTFKDRLLPLNIPVIYGMSFGHIDHQYTLPIGVEAELDTEKESIRLLDSGVE